LRRGAALWAAPTAPATARPGLRAPVDEPVPARPGATRRTTADRRDPHQDCGPRRRLTAGLVLSAWLLSACASGAGPVASVSGGRGNLNGTEIGDVIPRAALALPDTDGRMFDLQQRPQGELTALFFGYTNCPDVCPTTMADLAAARRQLSAADRQDLQVVFVTEDPQTDAPAVLRRWLDRFDPSFTGLIGGNARTAQVLDALKTSRAEIRPAEPAAATPHAHSSAASDDSHTTGDGRSVEHSGSVYAFTGDRVVVYTGGTTPSEYAADFRALLHP